MAKYKRTVTEEVRAFQWNDDCIPPEWFNNMLLIGRATPRDFPVTKMGLRGRDGWTVAERGDWIVSAANEHLYAVKPGVFDREFELVK